MVSSEHNEPSFDPTSPGVRVVLLGASNLTRGASVVIDVSRRRLGTPLDALLAMGHGRAYCGPSCLFGRTLPGIVQCGLWQALEERQATSTMALVTDIGNDLMYGVAVEEIFATVTECLKRLAAAGSRVVMTLLPVRSLAHLSRTRYYLLRNVLYPRCCLGFDCLVDRVGELNEKLRSLGSSNVRLIEPRREWYGSDPIHLRRSRRRAAWAEILDGWPTIASAHRAAPGVRWRWRDTIGLSLERQWIFGVPRSRRQPVRHLRDNTALSLF